MPNLSRTLADHIASARYEQIPLAAIEAAKKSLLDALGVTLGASGMGEGCGAFVDLARAAGGGDASNGTCSDETNEAFIRSPFGINDEKERKDETGKSPGSSRYDGSTGKWRGYGHAFDAGLDTVA